jgi:DNA methylase
MGHRNFLRQVYNCQSFSEMMRIGGSAARLLDALRSAMGDTDLLAYLAMMAIRLQTLHTKIKGSGSLYLHCDPTASHYLKVILDAIFGQNNFRNEIVWKRTSAHNSARKWGPIHDNILFYSVSDKFDWQNSTQEYDQDYIDAFFVHSDEDGRRWRRADLTGSGVRHGESGKPWRGIDVTSKGRHWAVPHADLERLDSEGRIHWPKKEDGVPQKKRYIDELPGMPLQDMIFDIRPVHNVGKERIGYSTRGRLATACARARPPSVAIRLRSSGFRFLARAAPPLLCFVSSAIGAPKNHLGIDNSFLAKILAS